MDYSIFGSDMLGWYWFILTHLVTIAVLLYIAYRAVRAAHAAWHSCRRVGVVGITRHILCGRLAVHTAMPLDRGTQLRSHGLRPPWITPRDWMQLSLRERENLLLLVR